ncbi:MAG: hypothetical protein M3546_08870 [Actinomycetota bacterium]|nr:hypothetical protein [Actinomycetota bacterium]
MAREVAAEQLELEVARLGPLSRASQNGPSQREASGAKRPSPAQLLEMPCALLTRSHLRELGLERRAIDAVFRALPVVALPGYSRPMIRADQFLELVEHSTYHDDRVRPCHA